MIGDEDARNAKPAEQRTDIEAMIDSYEEPSELLSLTKSYKEGQKPSETSASDGKAPPSEDAKDDDGEDDEDDEDDEDEEEEDSEDEEEDEDEDEDEDESGVYSDEEDDQDTSMMEDDSGKRKNGKSAEAFLALKSVPCMNPQEEQAVQELARKNRMSQRGYDVKALDTFGWTARYKAVITQPKRSARECMMCAVDERRLFEAFEKHASAIAQKLVHEINLPISEKTIKPINVGGVAGGESLFLSLFLACMCVCIIVSCVCMNRVRCGWNISEVCS